MKILHSRLLRLFAALCVVSILLLLFLQPLLSAWVKSKLQSLLQHKLGGTVSIGSVQVGFWQGRYRVADLSVHNGRLGSLGLQQAHFPMVEVQASWTDLLAEPVLIQSMIAQGIDITLSSLPEEHLSTQRTEPTSTAGSSFNRRESPILIKSLSISGKLEYETSPGSQRHNFHIKQLSCESVRTDRIGSMKVSIHDSQEGFLYADLTSVDIPARACQGSLEAHMDMTVLNPILEPYWTGVIQSGTVDVKGEGAIHFAKARQSWNGDLNVQSLSVTERRDDRPFFHCDQIEIKGSKAEDGTPKGLRVELQKPVIFLRRQTDGHWSWDGWGRQSKAAAAPVPSTPTAQDKENEDQAGRFHFLSSLDFFTVHNGKVRFEDEAVLPGETIYQIRDLEVSVRPARNQKTTMHHMQINASTPGHKRNGLISIACTTAVGSSGKLNFSGQADLFALDLSPCSPYTEKYNNLKIRDGELFARARLGCQQEQLDSSASLILRDLDLKGKGTVTGKIFSVAVDGFLFFLRDTQGRLALDTHITGDLWHPDWGMDRAVSNMVKKGPVAMLKNASDILKKAGLDQVEELGEKFLGEFGDALKKIDKIIPIDKINDIFDHDNKKKNKKEKIEEKDEK